MAAYYQPPQYLIGPRIFPAYMHIVRLACVWATAVFLLVNAFNAVAAERPSTVIGAALIQLPFVLLQVLAWITLVFAAIEFVTQRFPEYSPNFARSRGAWSPRDLPPLEPADATGKKQRSYWMASVEVAFGFVVLGWLLLVPKNPYLMFGPGAAYLDSSPYMLAPIWMTAYWWIVSLNAVQLTWRCINLLRGAWRRRDAIQHIVVKTMGLVPLLILASKHDHAYLLLKQTVLDQAQYSQNLVQTNQGIHSVLLLLCVIVSAQLAWDIAQAIMAVMRKRAVAS